jgi:hypothetical protein
MRSIGMRRSLIVANQTLDTDKLTEAVQQRAAADAHEFYVVVPATSLKDQAASLGGTPDQGPSPQERAYALARQRLERALDHLRGLGVTVDGEVGDADAVEAVRIALGRFPAEEIIVSTLPLGMSHWLRRDLPARLRRTFDLPVTHLVAETVS